jgi:hypothetical protein
MASATILLSAVAGPTTSAAVQIAGELDIVCHVFASAGTSTTLLQTSLDNATWFTVATVTNASTTGEQWSIPRCDWFRVNATAVAGGNLTALLSTMRT